MPDLNHIRAKEQSRSFYSELARKSMTVDESFRVKRAADKALKCFLLSNYVSFLSNLLAE